MLLKLACYRGPGAQGTGGREETISRRHSGALSVQAEITDSSAALDPAKNYYNPFCPWESSAHPVAGPEAIDLFSSKNLSEKEKMNTRGSHIYIVCQACIGQKSNMGL